MLNCQLLKIIYASKKLSWLYNFNSLKKILTCKIKDLIYEHKVKTNGFLMNIQMKGGYCYAGI